MSLYILCFIILLFFIYHKFLLLYNLFLIGTNIVNVGNYLKSQKVEFKPTKTLKTEDDMIKFLKKCN